MTYKDARVIRLAGQVVPVKLNAEKEGRVAAAKYGVQGFPTILFLTGRGEVVGKIGGFLPPEPFAAQLKQVTESHKLMPSLLAKMKANPRDGVTAARLSSIYAMQQKLDSALQYLGVAEKNAQDAPELARAYNAVADIYQERGEFDTAIPYFEKAVKVSKSSNDTAYAHISIATCYFQSNRPKAAIPSLEALIAMEDAPKEFTEQGRQMLQAAKRAP